jgi:hypothetical protein
MSLSVGNHTITHHIPTQLRTFAGLPGIRAHFTERHQWETPAIFDLIDWPLHHAATLSNSFLKRLFVIKWIHNLLPLQHQQFQFNQVHRRTVRLHAVAKTKHSNTSLAAHIPSDNSLGLLSFR